MIKRIFIEPNNIYKDPIYEEIYNLIHHNGNGRITKESVDYFARPDTMGIGVCWYVKCSEYWILVGFSGCRTNPEVTNSITVVSTEFRGLNIGNKLLKEKIDLLPEFHTIVAEDNQASIKSCLKAGLFKVGESMGKRKDGEFKQIHFSKLALTDKASLNQIKPTHGSVGLMDGNLEYIPMPSPNEGYKLKYKTDPVKETKNNDSFMLKLFRELELALHPGG